MASSSPTRPDVGSRSPGRSGRGVAARHDRPLLPDVTPRAGVAHHGETVSFLRDRSRRRAARPSLGHNSEWTCRTPALGKRDQPFRLSPGAREVRAGRRVEQSQGLDAAGRLAKNRPEQRTRPWRGQPERSAPGPPPADGAIAGIEFVSCCPRPTRCVTSTRLRSAAGTAGRYNSVPGQVSRSRLIPPPLSIDKWMSCPMVRRTLQLVFTFKRNQTRARSLPLKSSWHQSAPRP